MKNVIKNPVKVAWYDLKVGQEIQIFHVRYQVLKNEAHAATLKTLDGTNTRKETKMAMPKLLRMIELHQEAETKGILKEQSEIRQRADERRKKLFPHRFSH